MAKKKDPTVRMAETLLRWKRDPVSMVQDLWGVTPDKWQAEVLRAFPKTPRIAMLSCAGPGKTFVLAMLGWNYMLTRKNCWIGVTSITRDNLEDGLWTELARWYEKSDLLKDWFEMTKSYIAARESRVWRMEARGWRQDADDTAIGNALRGPHADYIMWLLDETGDYPNAILPVCENIFAGAPREAHIVQAGNPSSLSGPLYHAAEVARDRWWVKEITADPEAADRTPRVSVEHARAQIDQYGVDDPYVRVNILGKFPLSNFNSLIGIDEVQAAMNRMYREHELKNTPRILGVDVAAEGADQSVICQRRGLQIFPMKKYRSLDSIQGASLVSREWTEFQADACFVDNTGGFGAGWADQLKQLGRQATRVTFNANADESGRYVNKRAEMIFELCEWIKRGGAIPADDRLLKALTQTTYTFRRDRLLIEPKDLVKKKIGYSPDEMDAAALTFAAPVQPRGNQRRARIGNAAKGSYDPFRAMESGTPGGW